MRRDRLAWTALVGASVATSAGCGAPSSSASGQAGGPVTIDTGTVHQTLEGFGAAVAWYQNTLVEHPRKAEIYELVFAELGLDLLRLRNRHQRIESDSSDLGPEAEIVEQATQSLGRTPQVLLTSWSPPATLKANAHENCSGNRDCTLRRDAGQFVYEQFADYWYDSLETYARVGIVPDFVSIQNEPDFIPNGWEGCGFSPTETEELPGYDQALVAVHERLSTLASPPRLLGPEVLGVHWGNLQEFTSAMDRSRVYALAHHLYEQGGDGVWDWKSPGPESYVDEMWAAARTADGAPIFQTEFQTDDDNFTEGGFETAWLIHNCMAHEDAAAFLYWNLVWPDSGLVALQGSSFTVRDQYYSLRHYARYTDPGYARVEASGGPPNLRVSAFASPERDWLTVVALNVGLIEYSFALDTGSFGVTGSEIYRTVYEPGASETWVSLGGLPEDNMLTLPPRAVMTVVLQG
jgi:glucuronoarabinoxylan endo-1,4-beta-xylanase